MITKPYFMSNEKWYYETDGVYYLTENAPADARRDYVKHSQEYNMNLRTQIMERGLSALMDLTEGFSYPLETKTEELIDKAN